MAFGVVNRMNKIENKIRHNRGFQWEVLIQTVGPLLCFLSFFGIIGGCLGRMEEKQQPASKKWSDEYRSEATIPENISLLSSKEVFWTSGTRFKLAVRDSIDTNELISVDKSVNRIIDFVYKRNYCNKPEFYRKQYQFLGTKDSGVALVNLFPKFDSTKDREDSFKEWKTSLVQVRDGEKNFCAIEYDTKNKRAIYFECNGPG